MKKERVVINNFLESLYMVKEDKLDIMNMVLEFKRYIALRY
jgi:hypothetical protein